MMSGMDDEVTLRPLAEADLVILERLTQDPAAAGEFAGHVLKVWFRNENHVSWLDGEPWVASPDLMEFCATNIPRYKPVSSV